MSIQVDLIEIGVGVPPETGTRQSLPPPLTIKAEPSGVHSGAANRRGESSTTFGEEPSTPTSVIRVRVASLPIQGGSSASDTVARNESKAAIGRAMRP